MFRFKVFWIIALFSCNVLGMNSNSREKPKTEGRQLQSFFPQEESSNPNFQPSPSDVYFVDGNNQVQDARPKQKYQHNPKFSPNLQNDLYNSQYGAQQQQIQQQQIQQQHIQQQQLQQQQIQQQQIQQQYQQQQQQQQYQYAQQTHQYTNPSKPFYPTPDGNDISYSEVQPQYSPQSQQYVDNTNFIYTEPPQYQSQSPYDQGYSQVVTGEYVVGNRPQVNIPPQQRPSHSLYNPNHPHPHQYGGNSRPIYQSQHNYNLRPPPNGYGNGVNEGGIMESIGNFFSNIGQTASELLSNRPPINQYQPPPSVSAGLANRPPNQPQARPQGNPQFGSANPPFGGPGNPVNQFSKAIEEITRNDDYQCIPKVICQMVGSQRRQPSILSSPIFTAIISAVPSTSSGLVYGRAALLGLISGEQNCQTAYPRCPRNEDDLLYYLNNHRGGFFRFFNGGAAFGDDLNQQYNPNHQQQYPSQSASNQYYHQSQPPQQQQHNQPDDQSLQSSLASLQGIADAINNGGGINLSNLGANANLFSGLAGLLNGGGSGSSSPGGFDLSSLGSNAGLLSNFASLVGGQAPKPSKAPPDDQGQSLTELVGNLLTGFVGQRFAGRNIERRKINKRSIDVEFDGNENSTGIFDLHERKWPKKVSAFKLKLAASKKKFKFPEDSHEIGEENDQTQDEDDVEGRIINTKPAIYSDDEDEGDRYNDRFVFNSNRDSKKVNFMNRITGPTPLPNYASDSHSQIYFNDNNKNNDEFRIVSNNRPPKFMKFHSNVGESGPNYNPFFQQAVQQDTVRFGDTATQRPSPSKMIFPDRTGTGNLRFDHDEFDHENYNRYGKILNYVNKRPQSNDATRVTFGQTDRYSADSQSNYRPSYSGNYQNNQGTNANNYYNPNYPTHNRYTSSSNRQRDDNSSQNIYVTNSEGKTVYYINAQGKKVYV